MMSRLGTRCSQTSQSNQSKYIYFAAVTEYAKAEKLFACLINNSTYTNHFKIYTQIHLHTYKPIQG